MRSALDHVNRDFTKICGDEYKRLLVCWARFEEHHSYENPSPSRALPKTNRPLEVEKWIKDGRRQYRPLLDNEAKLSVFANNVQNWWSELKPSEESQDDWGRLNYWGKNGWFSLVVCFRWWGDAIQDLNVEHESKQRWITTLKDASKTSSDLLKHMFHSLSS